MQSRQLSQKSALTHATFKTPLITWWTWADAHTQTWEQCLTFSVGASAGLDDFLNIPPNALPFSWNTGFSLFTLFTPNNNHSVQNTWSDWSPFISAVDTFPDPPLCWTPPTDCRCSLTDVSVPTDSPETRITCSHQITWPVRSYTAQTVFGGTSASHAGPTQCVQGDLHPSEAFNHYLFRTNTKKQGLCTTVIAMTTRLVQCFQTTCSQLGRLVCLFCISDSHDLVLTLIINKMRSYESDDESLVSCEERIWPGGFFKTAEDDRSTVSFRKNTET